MSGTPKRSPDEGGHSSSSRQTNEEIGSSYPKLMPSVVNDYTIFKMGPDGRVAKVPRSAYCDADRRSPLHSLHRMPSSSNDADMGAHPIASESKVEVRDPRDGRDHLVENRDSRTEVRQLHGEAKRDSLSGKGEKDIRFVSRGEDNKETKYGKDTTTDAKNDKKIEKDGLNVGKRSNQLNWKESIEFLRGKKYSESHGAHVDPWPMSRGGSQVPTEFGKEGSNAEDRDWDAAEPNEAAGEKKFDFKGEDRFKEKDAKLREWGDSYKERSERRSSTPVGNIVIDGKELSREEKDREDKGTEKWEKEKKDRERLKEKEKDLINTEPSGAGEKEGLTIEKEMGDEFAKITLHEKSYVEQMKQKNVDKSKNIEKEAKGRRKDGEGGDMDGDKAEKRSRLCDKEPDDGCAEGEGDAERDREGFGYGVQQRKRMYRSRGSPQLTNRDSRFRSHAQENEGSQAKSEMSSVVYKVGECMRDLIKLWKEYELSKSDKNGDNTYDGPTLEIRIPAEHVTATNRQVRGGQLWGTDIYTDDSDLVAVLMHTGYCRPTAAPPPSAIQELCATIRVLPPQDSYTSMLRNNVRSRSWGAGIGCSYRVERCCIVKKRGGTIDLEPCLTHTSAIEPTIAPVAVERTMTTRAAASNALRQQRFVREVTIQYNLCNEPWIKYSISVVADKGLKKPLFTSARLKKGEVLYLETHTCRYELCFDGERMVKAAPAVQVHEEMEKSLIHYHRSSNGDRNDSDHVLIDSFRWSRCKKPLPQTVMRSVGIPLPLDYVEVLEENLDWEDVQWSQMGVSIAGKEYTLARVHFLSAN